MKRFSQFILSLVIIVIIMVCLPSLIHAQGPGAPDPGCGPDIPPELCPIDGGLSTLFAIGVGYGIKKYKEAKSSLASQDDAFSN